MECIGWKIMIDRIHKFANSKVNAVEEMQLSLFGFYLFIISITNKSNIIDYYTQSGSQCKGCRCYFKKSIALVSTFYVYLFIK